MSEHIPKTKPQLIDEAKRKQDADRRRKIIKDIVFPCLSEMKQPIGWVKVFLQAFQALVSGTFDERAKLTTINDIYPRMHEKLSELFTVSKDDQREEMNRYLKLMEVLKEVSVQDFAYAAELPRYIEGYFTSLNDKETLDKVDIEKIMG